MEFLKNKPTIKSLSIFLASPKQIRGSRPWLKNTDENICAETWLDRKNDHGWSYGEITKAETINYKTLKPERGGLFDEVIFGPTRDFECSCGKYKKSKFAGKVCEKCGVEVIETIVRRERMGHIELAAPVAHIWMAKDSPAAPKIGLVLGMKSKVVEAIIYYNSYIVIEAPKNSLFEEGEIINLSAAAASQSIRIKLRKLLEEIRNTFASKESFEYQIASEYYDKLKDGTTTFSIDDIFAFVYKYKHIKIMTGAEALQILLKKIDLDAEYVKIKSELSKLKETDHNFSVLLRRLEMIYLFINNSKIKPEYMIMNVLPVTPPDTRPVIQLQNGNFTTSDINNLYKKIITRNERLAKMIELHAPTIIVNNEKRLLQEAVDALFDNSNKTSVSKEKRPLKSLTEHLGGKQGIFRQNLLGKRVDFSARSVIVCGPELKLYQVGLPSEIVLKLYKPFIIAELVKKVDIEAVDAQPIAENTKVAEKMIDDEIPEIWPIVTELLKERPVLLNRQPSLHKLSLQAFEPVLVSGKAIRLHPLACEAFNGDFDGDAMAVHLPLSDESIAEARRDMLASWHIMGPKDGKPVVSPRQDMVHGIFLICQEVKGQTGEGSIFSSIAEMNAALIAKKINFNTIIGLNTAAFPKKSNLKQNKILITTAGKVLFNAELPEDFIYVNNSNLTITDDIDYLPHATKIVDIVSNRNVDTISKKSVTNVIILLSKKYDLYDVGKYADNIQRIAFRFAALSSATCSTIELPIYDKKYAYIAEANKQVETVEKHFLKGLLSDDERYSNIIKIWTKIKDKVEADMKEIIDNKENASNSFVTMIKSGARGNIAQFTSILGMRGLMNKAYNYEKAAKTKVVKDTIETPITHSLLEGVSSLEFFNASFGSRKAQADIQLKTSKSGYMTRKLVDCAQEIVVTQDDCHPLEGLVVTDLYNKDGKVSATLESRIIGRYAFEDVVDASNKVLVAKDELITEELAEKITKAGIKEVSIRSPIHCKCKTGVCQKCYGLDLTNNKLVKIGEPVGVVAGQSIGEPSTQLNMRSKQTGGLVGAGGNIAQGFERLAQLLDVVSPKPLELAKIATVGGTINSIIETEDGFDVVISADITNEMVTIKSEKNKNILVKTGDVVKRGQMLFKGSINLKTLLEVSGIEAVRQYLLSELQNIYKSQGIDVNDKYLEIIISQMTNKVRVLTNNEQYDLFIGKIINSKKLEEINEKLLTDARKSPIIAKPIVISVDDVPDNSSSFFSSASFQYSKQVLSHACISGEVDFLKGLKENVMLGGLIPAGTGLLSDTDELFKGAEEAYNKEW